MSTTLTTTAPVAPVCPECKSGWISAIYSYAVAELVAVAPGGFPTVGPAEDMEVAGYQCGSCEYETTDPSVFVPALPFCLACEAEHEDPYPTPDGYVSCDSCDEAATVVTDTLHLCDDCANDEDAEDAEG